MTNFEARLRGFGQIVRVPFGREGIIIGYLQRPPGRSGRRRAGGVSSIRIQVQYDDGEWEYFRARDLRYAGEPPKEDVPVPPGAVHNLYKETPSVTHAERARVLEDHQGSYTTLAEALDQYRGAIEEAEVLCRTVGVSDLIRERALSRLGNARKQFVAYVKRFETDLLRDRRGV